MSFGLYAIGFAIMLGGLVLGRASDAHAHALDRRGRDRSLRRWDFVGSEGDAPERFFAVGVLIDRARS
jgi:hypothetical protein